MQPFVIFTDSACDIDEALLTEWGVRCLSLSYAFENGENGADGDIHWFYEQMRAGRVAKTNAVNPEAFHSAFEPLLREGQDVLYLAFSSGLSTTCNSARIAADELAEAYPDRKVRVVDSLCASAGEGLFVYLVAQHREENTTLEELAAYAEEIKLHICHWFTVDDLVYLKRGGRVSPTVAFVGNMLGIKPVLHVDDEGHLINVSKARGRKAAVAALAEQYARLAVDAAGGTVFISNGDCPEDARTLAQLLRDRHGVAVQHIADIGPVIGAHSGPGTLALFFVGDHR